MIERPMHVTQLVKEAFDNRFPSTSEAPELEDAQTATAAHQCATAGAAVLGGEAAVPTFAVANG